MSSVSLFIGCLIPNRYPGIEKATKLCLDMLEVDWVELEGASCCPAPGVFRSFDEAAWLAVASRNIVLSEKMQRDVLTICNGCYGSLADANLRLTSSEQLRLKTNEHLAVIGREFKGSVDVRHIIEFFYREIGPERIAASVSRKLDLRIAVHYGCHLLKPSADRNAGSVERPDFFDGLVEATGCESVEYPDKMACCGAGGGVRSGLREGSLAMTEHKLKILDDYDVDCIVNACPFCHLQFDAGQVEINRNKGTSYKIPVLHYTQLLGLALGFSIRDLGIDLNAVVSTELMEKLGQID